MPYIKGTDRNQSTMFPELIDDYISSDNPVRVIDAYVEQVDMVAHNFSFAICPKTGRPPYDPRVMLKLYLYGYLNRTRSSRRLEDEAKRNLEAIWLLQKLTPDFKTIAGFRKNNKKALKELFKDFSRLCKDWGLFGSLWGLFGCLWGLFLDYVNHPFEPTPEKAIYHRSSRHLVKIWLLTGKWGVCNHEMGSL